VLAADQVGVAALTDRKGGSLANRWDRVRVARWAYLLAALAIAGWCALADATSLQGRAGSTRRAAGSSAG